MSGRQQRAFTSEDLLDSRSIPWSLSLFDDAICRLSRRTRLIVSHRLRLSIDWPLCRSVKVGHAHPDIGSGGGGGGGAAAKQITNRPTLTANEERNPSMLIAMAMMVAMTAGERRAIRERERERGSGVFCLARGNKWTGCNYRTRCRRAMQNNQRPGNSSSGAELNLGPRASPSRLLLMRVHLFACSFVTVH